MRKFLISSLIAVLALAGGGYFVLWNLAAERLRERIAGTPPDELGGLELSYKGLAVSGFPLWLRAELDEAHLHGNLGYGFIESGESGPAGSYRFDWHTDRLLVEIRPWRPQRLVLRVPSPHPSALRIRLPGSQFPWTALAGSAAATLALDRHGQVTDITFTATGIQHQEPVSFSGGRADSLVLKAHALDAGGRSFETTVSALGIALPAWADNPLGRNIESVVLMGWITQDRPGPSPKDPPWAEIERLDLRWGPFEMLADGAIAFRPGAPPEGKLSAEIRGFEETVEALAFARMLSSDNARTAKTALSLLAKPSPDDGVPTLSVTLTATNGKLYVGPFALLRLAPLPLGPEPRSIESGQQAGIFR
jgi:hypothetical protein